MTVKTKPEQDQPKETPTISVTYEPGISTGEVRRDPRWVLKINSEEKFLPLTKGDRKSRTTVFQHIATHVKEKYGLELERTSRYQFTARKPAQNAQETLAA